MKTLPTNGMPFEMYQQIQAAKYGHPNVYPNSEHIKPPQEKERIRVVEAATRAEIKLNRVKEIEERAKEVQRQHGQRIAVLVVEERADHVLCRLE